MSTLVKFDTESASIAKFTAELDAARSEVAETLANLPKLIEGGKNPATRVQCLAAVKSALRIVTPFRTGLDRARKDAKRAIDERADSLFPMVEAVEKPLQDAKREIEAFEQNEAAARVAAAEAAEKERKDREEAEKEAERKRLADENAKLRAELDAARAARMDEAAAKLGEMRMRPVHQWKLDGKNVGTDSNSYTVVSEGVVTCEVSFAPEPDPNGLAAAMASVAAEMDAAHEPAPLPASFKGATCLQGSDADAINRFAGSLGDWMVREKPMLVEDAAKEWFAHNVVDVFRQVFRKCKEYR